MFWTPWLTILLALQLESRQAQTDSKREPVLSFFCQVATDSYRRQIQSSSQVHRGPCLCRLNTRPPAVMLRHGSKYKFVYVLFGMKFIAPCSDCVQMVARQWCADSGQDTDLEGGLAGQLQHWRHHRLVWFPLVSHGNFNTERLFECQISSLSSPPGTPNLIEMLARPAFIPSRN